MKNKIRTFAIGIIAATMLFSCGKDGATGPAGATGPQGATGNANVQVFNVQALPTQWTADTYSGWFNTITNTSFGTGLDLTKCGVNLYWSIDNVNWETLPYVAPSTSTSPNINVSINANTIYVNIDPSNATTAVSQPTSIQYFKAIIIPPASRMAHPNVNLHDYAEVKKAFELK